MKLFSIDHILVYCEVATLQMEIQKLIIHVSWCLKEDLPYFQTLGAWIPLFNHGEQFFSQIGRPTT